MAMDKAGRLNRIDYGDRVYFDSIAGIAGTTYPIGTAGMPSDVIANIITICTALGIFDIDVHGVLQIGAAMEHYCFSGHYHESIVDTLDMNGQDVDDSRFERLVVTGAQGGTGLATYIDCVMYNTAALRGLLKRCSIYGTIAIATGGAADFVDMDGCISIHGAVTLTVATPDRLSIKDWRGNLTLTAQTGGPVFLRGFDGALIVDAMTGGTLDIYADAADIQINADCTGGIINIYGNARVVNNAVGAAVNDYSIDQRAEDIDDKVSGILVQVPFFVEMDTINGGVITLFEFDALGATIRDVFISFYLPASAGTFTLTWEKTRPGDLVTFTTELVGAPCIPMANIAAPGAAQYYSYRLGEIAQGLQGRFRIAEDANAAVTVDAFAVVVMEI